MLSNFWQLVLKWSVFALATMLALDYKEQLTSKHAWPILLGYAIDLVLTVTSLKRCMGVCCGYKTS